VDLWQRRIPGLPWATMWVSWDNLWWGQFLVRQNKKIHCVLVYLRRMRTQTAVRLACLPAARNRRQGARRLCYSLRRKNMFAVSPICPAACRQPRRTPRWLVKQQHLRGCRVQCHVPPLEMRRYPRLLTGRSRQ